LEQGLDVLQPVRHALVWVRETNSWVCRYVLKDGISSITGSELSGRYYDGAVHVVESQIMLAASRLAVWTNALAIAHGGIDIA
jgi:hypothetical protein